MQEVRLPRGLTLSRAVRLHSPALPQSHIALTRTALTTRRRCAIALTGSLSSWYPMCLLFRLAKSRSAAS